MRSAGTPLCVMLAIVPQPLAMRLNTSSPNSYPTPAFSVWLRLADVEELAERAAHFVAPVVLDVRELAAADREVRLRGIGVLAHRRQVAGIERRQVPEIRDRHVFVVLFHVEIAHVE